jgi:hypothetical protein
MTKAYDRVRNADNGSDNFIKTPYWTNEVEAHFEVWKAAAGLPAFDELCDGLLEEEVAVSLKALDGSICCTLAHRASKDAGLPYLLTGWSDNCVEALTVALYKLKVMMSGVWEAPKLPPAPRRR